jgi:hypothetical protein
VPRAVDGGLGDGIAISGVDSVADLQRVTVVRSARAAVSAFGSRITIADSVLECNPIDLDGETVPSGTYSFQDLGGNVCGCDGVEEICQVLSSDVAPPEELP